MKVTQQRDVLESFLGGILGPMMAIRGISGLLGMILPAYFWDIPSAWLLSLLICQSIA